MTTLEELRTAAQTAEAAAAAIDAEVKATRDLLQDLLRKQLEAHNLRSQAVAAYTQAEAVQAATA